ncbi:ABC transporter permease [Bacillus kexueae]|uniref:ABC transporter permease n=1 Tax=Aeribacillus kexueae TaxID=2078952 RepID=UPI001FAFB475|nr:iron export ABC transporter permease subunit FetB [Bacillus kexueae]
MKESIIDIQLVRFIAAYLFIILLLFLIRVRGIKREKRIFIASIRMTLQLVLVGYILSYIFENPNPITTLVIILIMEAFAIYNVYKQIQLKGYLQLQRVIAVAMLLGTLFTLFYFNFVVVQFNPWYDPRYFIPIAGMIIGNTMTGVSLGIKSLLEGFRQERFLIEGALMLGAKPEVAVKSIVNDSFDSAILPTINSMVGMGIIFLPGMMTGQILSGTSPLIAIEYQIVVLLGIAGSVGISVFIALHYGVRTFFNEKSQLRIDA